ncbi:GNAT family N-acetyltransferase [Flavobacterium sp. DG1-102-2]|uniref:GNAT family N-acetyltransferase n=1 Tax=Flavobacterium sp. DG1-102-2 TaxID=3081663 RepID=UPI002948E6C7|nr:GNAT family N-acetyltransferase [Flavobacterium sp. DG1-102-2]MDV6168487.1 GNAT family N-acetyltransferase [Flavobacterium sp. DG1-102-2]
MEYRFRKAQKEDAQQIRDILRQAIERRKQDGSRQWQDGYPNLEVVENDIEKEVGHVLTDDEVVIGYSAVLINYEPAYNDIEGKWLTNEDFVVMHRVAVSQNYLGKGLAIYILRQIEELALTSGIKSIKADTNFDNAAMMNIFEKLEYSYCGEVHFRGSARKAYEKVLGWQ